MGLLDYLKNGFNNSVGHLTDIENSITNQPKMYDPHANAKSLMGGTPMGQPQGLLNNAYGQGTDTFNTQTNDQSSFIPQPPTKGQEQQITYQGGAEAGVNYPNFDPSAINPYLDGDQTGEVGGYVNNGQNVVNENFNNRATPPQTGSLLMGSPEVYQKPSEYESDETDYSKVGVDSNVSVGQPQVSVGGPFDLFKRSDNPAGGGFNPITMTDSEKEEYIRLREEAKARLPWYLGGSGGK